MSRRRYESKFMNRELTKSFPERSGSKMGRRSLLRAGETSMRHCTYCGGSDVSSRGWPRPLASSPLVKFSTLETF